MVKGKILFRQFLLPVFIFSSLSCVFAQQQRFSFSSTKMGSPFNIIFYATDSATAKTLAEQSFRLVDSFVLIFSDYIDSSELNRLCASAGRSEKATVVSTALFDILRESKLGFEKSKGTFDISLGPITRLWRMARKQNIFPADSIVQMKLTLTGFQKVHLDSVHHSVYFDQAGMQLDLGGIGQGYIAQRVIDFLRSKGIATALVDVSGDIAAIGAPPGTHGWTIGINVPEQPDELLKKFILVHDAAVTTSGDAYQFMIHDGKRYSHIIDPKTGYGLVVQKNVTVIASDGTIADWLTKACSILPIREAKELARSMGAEVLVAYNKGGKVKLYSSRGFKDFWKK